MVLRQAAKVLGIAISLILASGGPALAHREHRNAAEATERMERTHDAPGTEIATQTASAAHREAANETRPTTVAGRLLDWIGRTHPALVHFPLALFPVAMLAILLARRRERWTPAAEILVVMAGFSTLPAIFAGWLGAGWPEAADEGLLVAHRWLGTGIALAGTGLAFAVWRGRSAPEGRLVLAVTSLIAAALVVQGWLGGALVHGIDHLNF